MQILVNKENAHPRTVNQVVEEYVSKGYRLLHYFEDHNQQLAARVMKPESHRDYLLRNRRR